MKKLSRPARQILKYPPSIQSVLNMSSLRLVAHLTQHAALLSNEQLAALPRMGVVLFDPEDLITHRVDFDSLAVKVLHMDDIEIRRAVAGRLRAIAAFMFDGLEEWALIERHERNQPTCPWAELSRQDRIACVGTLLSTLGAWEMLWRDPRILEPHH